MDLEPPPLFQTGFPYRALKILLFGISCSWSIVTNLINAFISFGLEFKNTGSYMYTAFFKFRLRMLIFDLQYDNPLNINIGYFDSL